jgi:site-specific DNA recombinase
LIHCDCGKKMYVYSNKALHYKCRPCDRKISVDDINEIFQEQLKTFLFSDHDLSSYLDNNNDVIKEKEHLIENLLNEAKSLEKKMKQFIDMRLEETISKENFTLYYTPIEQQHAQIQERLPELQAEVDILKVQFLSSDSVIQSAQDLYQQWGDIPHEDKRSIVELITEKITIGKEDIEISLSYLPSPLNRGKKQHNLRDSWRRST